MMSKLVPRKARGFETHMTENPTFQALIPLYPEPDVAGTKVDKVKVRVTQ